MEFKAVFGSCLACLAIGLYLGKTYYAKTETVEIEKEVVRNNVVTVTHEVTKPDGTKESTTTTTDKSTAKKDSSSVATVPETRSDWHVSASASAQPGQLIPIYGLQIERSILGPFSAGVRAETTGNIGVVIGYTF